MPAARVQKKKAAALAMRHSEEDDSIRHWPGPNWPTCRVRASSKVSGAMLGVEGGVLLLLTVVCSTTGAAALTAAVRSFMELKDSTVAAVE